MRMITCDGAVVSATAAGAAFPALQGASGADGCTVASAAAGAAAGCAGTAAGHPPAGGASGPCSSEAGAEALPQPPRAPAACGASPDRARPSAAPPSAALAEVVDIIPRFPASTPPPSPSARECEGAGDTNGEGRWLRCSVGTSADEEGWGGSCSWPGGWSEAGPVARRVGPSDAGFWADGAGCCCCCCCCCCCFCCDSSGAAAGAAGGAGTGSAAGGRGASPLVGPSSSVGRVTPPCAHTSRRLRDVASDSYDKAGGLHQVRPALAQATALQRIGSMLEGTQYRHHRFAGSMSPCLRLSFMC